MIGDLLLVFCILSASLVSWQMGRLNERGRWLKKLGQDSAVTLAAFEDLEQRARRGESVTEEELVFLRGRMAANKAIWQGGPE